MAAVPSPSVSVAQRGTTHTLLTYLPYALLLVVALLPLLAGIKSIGRLNDDSYITLTYIKSLVAGEGWRYNGGVEALGTTTPLFALVVAVLATLLPFFTIEQIAVGWSILCWWGLAGCFALGYRTWGLKRYEGYLIALVLLLQGGYWFASLGMEATFLLVGVVGVAWVAVRGYVASAGVGAALLFLIRPEGLAMVPLAGVWLLWHRRSEWRRVCLRFGIAVLVPLALWSVYAYTTFGAILSNSANAKLAQGDNWSGITFTQRLFTEWLPGHFAAYGVSPLLSVLWILGATGIILLLRTTRPLTLIVAWVALFLVGYTLLQAPPYWWYMLPVLFGIQLLATLGWIGIGRWSPPRLRALLLVALVTYLSVVGYRSVNGVRTLQGDKRADSYKSLVAWVNQTPENSTVAFVEIGYLGYFSERPIIDLVGLTDPRLTEHGATLDLATNFRQTTPDYFVYVEDFDWLLGAIVREPEFARHYRLEAELPSHLSHPFQIYKYVP